MRPRGRGEGSRNLKEENLPTYRYKCECEHILEVQHSMTEDPIMICEDCNKEMQRTLSVPSIRFNGSGFYSTDK